MAGKPSSAATVDVAIGIVVHHGRILICRRHGDAVLGGFWEFPGGKVEAGEAVEACLHRELREELGIGIRIRQPMATIQHAYAHACVRLHPFVCDLLQGEARPIQSAELKWIAPAELKHHPFPPANARLLEKLQAELNLTSGDEPTAPR
jgi:mutator protein MutT